jgi:ABC-type branched-subunit amino acid transport system substrate-binding protein
MDVSSLKAARSVLTTEHFQAYADARLRSGAAPAAPLDPVPVGRRAKTSAPTSMPIAVEKLRIGCLLPLSGRYAPYGQRSLNGIQLALGSEAGRLVVRDTQGQPQIARAALDAFIADDQIAVVIGPLRSQIAEVVAPRAERAGLPLIVLSQRGGIGGSYVIQPSMTDRRQAASLAEYVLRRRGLRRFAILHPSDSYGTALSEAFRAEVQRRQGEIVGTLAYGAGAQEFSAEVLSVRKWIDDKALQAVFIPDSAATAVQLASDLRRAQPELVLLGGNGWYAPTELGRAGGVIDGAVFVNGFFAASGRLATRAFVAAYEQTYQSDPEILEAQAYDAATLVKRAIGGGAQSRAGFLSSVRDAGPFEGAAGDVRFGADGLERELFLLEVRGGAVREVGMALGPMDQPAPVSRPLTTLDE